MRTTYNKLLIIFYNILFLHHESEVRMERWILAHTLNPPWWVKNVQKPNHDDATLVSRGLRPIHMFTLLIVFLKSFIKGKSIPPFNCITAIPSLAIPITGAPLQPCMINVNAFFIMHRYISRLYIKFMK